MEQEIYMCEDKSDRWENSTIDKVKTAGNLNESFRLLAEEISSCYPGIKIWFTKKSGKRESYITGAGREQFIAPQKYRLDTRYNVFIEDDNNLNEEEKEKIVDMCCILMIDY